MTLPAYVRWPLAALLVAHGAVHVLGFISTFELAQIEEIGGPTLIVTGLDNGHPVMLALGIVWLIAMLAFMVAGIGVALRAPWSLPLAAVIAGLSLIPTILWWNDAWRGALLSGVILVAIVALRPRFTTLRPPGAGWGGPHSSSKAATPSGGNAGHLSTLPHRR